MFNKSLFTILSLIASINAVAITPRQQQEEQVRIKSKTYNTLCLTADTKGSDIGAGVEVQPIGCYEDSDPKSKLQKWSSISEGPTGLTVVSIRDEADQAKYCLDRGEDGPDDGVSVKLSRCTVNDNGSLPVSQLWSFDENNNQIFNYVNSTAWEGTPEAEERKCLDIRQDSVVVGEDSQGILQLYSCLEGNSNQVWTLSKV